MRDISDEILCQLLQLITYIRSIVIIIKSFNLIPSRRNNNRKKRRKSKR